jgi:hypothetical protein
MIQEYYNTIPLLILFVILIVAGYFLEFRKYSQPIQKYYIIYTIALSLGLYVLFVVTNKGIFFNPKAYKSVSQFSAIIPIFISNLIFSEFIYPKLLSIKTPNQFDKRLIKQISHKNYRLIFLFMILFFFVLGVILTLIENQ